MGLDFTDSTVVSDWTWAGATETSIAYTPEGDPVISYITGSFLFGELWVAIRLDGAWSHVLPATGISTGPAVAVDRDGHIIVSYVSNDGVVVAKSGHQVEGQWSSYVVREAEAGLSFHHVALALDRDGYPGLTYVADRGLGRNQDDTLEIAHFDGHL